MKFIKKLLTSGGDENKRGVNTYYEHPGLGRIYFITCQTVSKPCLDLSA